MTRRQIHAALFLVGLLWTVVAWQDQLPYWLNRSDAFYIGIVIMALGLHGLWKRDPR